MSADKKYEQRVRWAEELMDAIEKRSGPTNEHDEFLLRQVRRYRDLMATATGEYEARIAIANLGHSWIDSGDWSSMFSKGIERLLTPVRTPS